MSDTSLDLIMTADSGLSFERGSHGRAWLAAPGREPRTFRQSSKRALAAALALRTIGASDIEIATVYLGRAPHCSRERLRAHVEICESQFAFAGYAGAWVRVRVGAYLAAVEALYGREHAKRAKVALGHLPADGTIWVVMLIPSITTTSDLAAEVGRRLQAITAAERKAAAPKRKAAAPKRKAAAPKRKTKAKAKAKAARK